MTYLRIKVARRKGGSIRRDAGTLRVVVKGEEKGSHIERICKR